MDPQRQFQSRRPRSQSDDPLDRRLDQWLETGRQLVDGVSGARPGRRSGAGARSGRSASASLDAVGRWMGDKIDWLLDEEDDLLLDGLQVQVGTSPGKGEEKHEDLRNRS